jgi:signal transduction histidine kinase
MLVYRSKRPMFAPLRPIAVIPTRLALAGAAIMAVLALVLGGLAQRAVVQSQAVAAVEANVAATIEDAQIQLQSAALAVRDGLAAGEATRWSAFDDATARLLRAIETARAQGRAVDELAAPLARRVEQWREFRELQRLGRADEALRRIADPSYVERTTAVDAAFARLIDGERRAAAERARVLAESTGALLAGAGAAGLAALAGLGLALSAARRAGDALTADRERLRVAFDAMNEGILFYGPDERVTLVNPRMIETFPQLADRLTPGTHADDIVRRAFALGLYAGGDVESYLANRRLERRTPGVRRELALSDGRTILIRESATPGGGRVLLYTDATQEKAADRAKADFISTVSHELRTPLTSISGALALIGAGAAGELGPKARQLTDIAGRNAERLARLVDDLLHVQRLEAPIDDIVAVPVPLEPLLERAVAEIAPMALKRGVRIARAGAVPDPARVLGDEHRLIQVLHNLLSNAVKFSPAGERVDLSARQVGEMWRLSVSDRGPGIPPAFRAQVFRRFAQADGGDKRARGGTGLGLSIAKAIVDKLDGRISFETEMGTGTTFTVELAAAREEAPT